MKGLNISTLPALLAFDLDGTLAESKQPLAESMAQTLHRALFFTKVAIISGASFEQFQRQVISRLPHDPEAFKNLIFFPTNGARMISFDYAWHEVYSDLLEPNEKAEIMNAFERAFALAGYKQPANTHGPVFEDRGTQITFSALGQNAPVAEKNLWDPDQSKRQLIIGALSPLIPNFVARIGGGTSIDVTRKGFDKAYALKKAFRAVGCKPADAVFFGDTTAPGGNDHAATTTGAEVVTVTSPSETEAFIKAALDLPPKPPYQEKRPWGDFRQYTLNEKSTVKIITVKPGQALSLQYHQTRGEFWRVVAGTPRITVNGTIKKYEAGSEIYVAPGAHHRITAEAELVVILEIARGHFDEQDITRIDDTYGRSSEKPVPRDDL